MDALIDTAPRRTRSTGWRRALRRRAGLVVTAALLLLLVVPGVSSPASAASAAAPPAEREARDPSSPARWDWPVPAPHEVVRGFDAPEAVWSPGHRGIDIAGRAGLVVTAPESGRVHFAGIVVDRPVLSLEHAGGVLSSFEPVEPLVSRGDAVSRGQAVGILRAGHCDGSVCLHLGARIDGRYVSPLVLLGGAELSVLLPTRPLP